ncbi:hypothetical protein BUALT_Bualt13G0101000 [Buddleja alternifolia]|uniref:OVATE domain-containing protein n=1 Tax=Buddleja alternifolia TaxID=168488 RepID=A0AAV6WM15_9LAMI|nr:hypothetical protein BUALT_Bualt13G0101000 [Buddleja alternifolia]
MKLKKLSSIQCKLFKPWKLFHLFKFKLHKPLFIKFLRFRRHRKPKLIHTTHEGRLPKILSVLHSLRRTRDMDRVTELKSFSDAGHHKVPHPSPLTPAYIRMNKVTKDDVSEDQDDVEDSCRSFEKYLIQMIVEEGKMRDLVDVEELLYCWKNLRSPVFVDMVCRFYGELCKDLFSNSCENDSETPKGLLR